MRFPYPLGVLTQGSTIFDGLDEVPTLGERQDLVAEIERFAQCYPGNRILVTSRPVGYKTAPFNSRFFRHARIKDFDDDQIRQFLYSWYRHVLKYETLPTEVGKELELFYNALQDNVNLHRLATNPLMLTVMTAVHHFQHLPEKRVKVYDACAELLLNTWARLRQTHERWSGLRMGADDQKGCLAHLGFVLHQHAQGTTDRRPLRREAAVDVPAQFIKKQMRDYLLGQGVPMAIELNAQVELFLDLVRVEAGLLVERGTGDSGEPLYGFIHRTFQEYFAAIDLDNRRKQNDDPSVIPAFLDDHLHDPHWREVIMLLLSSLGRQLTTRYLARILEGTSRRSAYKSILQQDLYFVADCLAEDMDVRDEFAASVVKSLSTLVFESPFWSQSSRGLRTLHALLRTKQYAPPSRRALEDLMTRDGLEMRTRIYAAGALCGNAPGASADVHQPCASVILRELAERPDLAVQDRIAAARTLYQSSPRGSDGERQAVQVLLGLLQGPNVAIQDRIAAARTLYQSSPRGSDEERQAVQVLLGLLQDPELTVTDTIEAAQMLHRSSAAGSDERRQAVQVLLGLLKRSDIPVRERSLAAWPLYQNGESDERQQATQILLGLLQDPDLAVQDRIVAARTLYQSNPPGSDERRQAVQVSLSLLRDPNLPVQDRIAAARTLYQNYPGETDEKRQAGRILLGLLKRPNLAVTDRVAVARTLYQSSPSGSSEERQAVQVLLGLLKRPDLTVTDRVAVARTLYQSNPPGSVEYRQALQALRRVALNSDLSQEQRLEAACVPFTTRAGTPSDWRESVQLACSVASEESVKEHLIQHAGLPVSLADLLLPSLSRPEYPADLELSLSQMLFPHFERTVELTEAEVAAVADLTGQEALL